MQLTTWWVCRVICSNYSPEPLNLLVVSSSKCLACFWSDISLPFRQGSDTRPPRLLDERALRVRDLPSVHNVRGSTPAIRRALFLCVADTTPFVVSVCLHYLTRPAFFVSSGPYYRASAVFGLQEQQYFVHNSGELTYLHTYSNAPHNDVSFNDRPHIRQW